jgi:hypothetical protein
MLAFERNLFHVKQRFSSDTAKTNLQFGEIFSRQVQLSARRHAIRMTAPSETIRTGAAADCEE